MVYESEFSRKNFLNSCAQSGVFHKSSDYKPPASSTPSYLSIRSRSANAPSSLTANTGYGSSETNGMPIYRSRFSPSPQPQYETSRDREEYSSSAHGEDDRHRRVQYCTCCKNCCGGNYRGAAFIPRNAMGSADDMGAYLKQRTSRSGVRLRESEDVASARPIYSVRNVPVRSLDELREAVAIRRNYVKERKGLFHETGSMYGGSTPDREASPSLHPAESIRSSRRSSVSPSPIPTAIEVKAEANNGAEGEN